MLTCIFQGLKKCFFSSWGTLIEDTNKMGGRMKSFHSVTLSSKQGENNDQIWNTSRVTFLQGQSFVYIQNDFNDQV